MWASSMIGFGSFHYFYCSGREGDWFLAGFLPRKRNITVYIMSGFSRFADLITKSGKYKTGKSCLYINKFADIDMSVLKELIVESTKFMKEKHR